MNNGENMTYWNKKEETQDIRVRFYKTDYDKIHEIATNNGLNPGTWVRFLIMKYLKEHEKTETTSDV